MATHAYGDTPAHGGRSTGGQAFLWLAWAAAAIFWGLSFSTVMGIAGALGDPAGQSQGGIAAGGLSSGVLAAMAIMVLGAAATYGMMRYTGRDRPRPAMTEAATAQLYDTIERQGGDDLTSRSPEARGPLERDAYRDLQAPNRP